jgi:hypothetical protein
MLFELFTPQTLKGAATAVQGIRLRKIGRFTAQIAKFQFVRRHTGICCHVQIAKKII